MKFKSFILIIAVYLTSMHVIAAGAQVEAAPAETDIGLQHRPDKPCTAPPQKTDMKYLGNVGNKQFFVLSNYTLFSWQESVTLCSQYGMVLVKIGNKNEMEFVNKVVLTDNIGPVWFGARDLGGSSAFKWTITANASATESYYTTIGSFVNFSDLLQSGPLALQMNSDVSKMVYPSPSFLKSAQAFCQSPANHT